MRLGVSPSTMAGTLTPVSRRGLPALPAVAVAARLRDSPGHAQHKSKQSREPTIQGTGE